jgi:polyhydroxyalkanoate synthase subunit PhaE
MTEERSDLAAPTIDAIETFVDLWRKGGQAFLEAQQTFLSGMTEQMKVAGARASFASSGAHNLEAERLAASSQAFFELWSSAAKLSAGAAAANEGMDGNRTAAALLNRIFDPSLWLSAVGGMDQGLDRVAEGPRLADLFDTERRFLAVFRAWLAVRRRAYEHNSLMLRAWTRATTLFSKVLNEKGETGESLESWRDVLAIWVESANTVLLETQRGDAYLESQRQIVAASSELRLAQKEVAEFYSEMFAIPTRTELDDVHKGVTELRRQIRTLRRAVNEAPPARRRSKASR